MNIAEILTRIPSEKALNIETDSVPEGEFSTEFTLNFNEIVATDAENESSVSAPDIIEPGLDDEGATPPPPAEELIEEDAVEAPKLPPETTPLHSQRILKGKPVDPQFYEQRSNLPTAKKTTIHHQSIDIISAKTAKAPVEMLQPRAPNMVPEGEGEIVTKSVAIHDVNIAKPIPVKTPKIVPKLDVETVGRRASQPELQHANAPRSISAPDVYQTIAPQAPGNAVFAMPTMDVAGANLAVSNSDLLQVLPSQMEFSTHQPKALVVAQTPTAMTAQKQKQTVSQVSVAISKATEGKLELRLDPPELGRVQISITQNEAGTSVQILAEKADILDLLKRNADILARELAKSGLGDASLEFSQQHRGNSDANSEDYWGEPLEGSSQLAVENTNNYVRILTSNSLDIRL